MMEQKDFLTGCLTKAELEPALDKIEAECKTENKPFSIVVLDMDHFKTYNDKFGHLDGDDILKYFASTLRLSLEDQTMIFRFGGDEFVILFPGKSGKETYSVVHNVAKIFKKRPFLAHGRIYNLTFSGGIAFYPADGNNTANILENADKAMYFSKKHGRARTTLYKNILWKKIENILLALLVLLIAGTILYYLKMSSYSDHITNFLNKGMRKTSAFLARSSANIVNENLCSVYLKSGRIIKGSIVRDDKDAIELSVPTESGAGSVTINRANIVRIEKK